MDSAMMKLSALLLLTFLPLSSARTPDKLREVPVSDLDSSPMVVNGSIKKDQLVLEMSKRDQPTMAGTDMHQDRKSPPPPVKSVAGTVLEWVTWTGSLPNYAVSVYNDQERRTDYVCKFKCHAGFYTAAKGAYCYYANAKNEYAASAFEILVNRDNFEILGWEDGSKGSVPKNSVKTCPGEKIYVGKNKDGLGKVDVEQKVLVLARRGGQYSHKDYQVLTFGENVVSQDIYDAKYITDQAKVINFPPEIIHKTTLSNREYSPVKKTDTLTVTNQVTHRWDFDFSVALHHKTFLKVAIPLISFSSELGLDLFFQYSKENTVTDTITDTVSMDITAPPGQSCTVNIIKYKNKLSIPFTARLSRTYGNWDVHTTTITGTYSSVQVGEVRAVVDRCIPLNDYTPCP